MLNDGDKGVILQRDKQTYAVAPHLPCGVVTPAQLRKLADVAEKYGCAALKVTSAERIAMVGIKEADVDAMWKDLGMSPGAAVGLCVRSVKACPGTTFCKRGLQDSLGLGMKLDELYHGVELPAKFKIGVSGCPNQCAETCIKDLGFVGKRSGWTVMVGGQGGGKPRLAQELVEGLSDADALQIAEKVIAFVKEKVEGRQRLGWALEKIGFDNFKSCVLG
ncbi:MAG TPA: NAD(P)/FAD-dependent oxidoreductase [Candidatus Brocadiia bacterium]|nr:NAD(P)/FAD-dependent oxidoreductase [Candidatus Brocadiia bacterium]